MILILKRFIPSIILYIILLGIYRIIDNSVNNKRYNLDDIKYLLYIIYFIFLIYLVTLDDVLTCDPVNNYLPFKQILRYRIDNYLFLKNVIGNILLFIPFGSFFKIHFKIKLIWIIIITLIFSVSIELIQLLIGRVFDIDDIILNIVGSLLGSILCLNKAK